MQLKNYSILTLLILLASCKDKPIEKEETKGLSYIMDMVHNNPGEGKMTSLYSNPDFLKSRDYKSMVPHWYVNCAITYDNYENEIVPSGTPERDWIEDQANYIDKQLERSDAAGIAVYAFTDVFVAPKAIWDKYGEELGQQETEFHGYGGADENIRKPSIQNKRVQDLMRAQIAGIFDRFPSMDGLVIRFGETYLHDTPFHIGGKPVREGDLGITDHVLLLNILREEICVKRNKKLFYRTWDFGWFHTESEVYLSITDQIEPHPNLVFSIKHTKGDFQRKFPFNPTLGIGKHKQVVEVQAQREYEGKGAHPNYIGEAVINGFEELENESGPQGLKDLSTSSNLSGVFTWSRGGGWRGPYISNELWCDLNAYVISQWATDPQKDESEIFLSYCKLLELSDEDAKLFRELALLSNRGVLLGRSSKIADINPWWIRDQFMGGITEEAFNGQTDEAWGKLNKTFNAIIENEQTEAILEEKAEAVAIWRQIENLAQQISSGEEKTRDFIKTSSTYGRIKYEIIAQAWTIMLNGLEGDLTGSYDREKLAPAFLKYHNLWEEFKALAAGNGQVSTLYLPYSFSLDNDDLHTDEGMLKTVEHYEKLLQN